VNTETEFRPSSFLATKGAMIEPVYRAFRDWDLSESQAENIKRIRETNSVGGPSNGWLKDFGKILFRRFDVATRDQTIVLAAQLGWHISDWTPLLLWHISQSDPLLFHFIGEWLFSLQEEGVVVITSLAAREHLQEHLAAGTTDDAPIWSDSNLSSSANGLLRTAADFSLLQGHRNKEFTSYRLPELSFMYMLHALMDREQNTRKLIDAADWRVFLLRPEDVENELLRLHQFGKLRFERAGSFLELTLPFDAAEDFVRGQAA
tara:strand:- start:3546 stop:4331 length:786 start_codon:yes stop_codon:yes gene_type:complete